MTAPSDNRTWLRAIALMIAAAALFAVVDGLSKMLATDQSVGQIVWARYTFAIPVLLWASPNPEWRTLFRTRQRLDQIIRGLIPMGISISMVLAVRHLPLAEATVILYIGPLLVVALSQPLLGEKAHLPAWIGVCVGFLAVLIVARPGFSDLSLYTLFPITAALFYSFFQIFTRKLGAAGERPETTLAWTLAIGVAIATPLATVTWQPLTGIAWLIMIALGLTFGLAQIFTIRAFAHAPANRLAPFSYAQIVGAALFGMAVFGAVPDAWTWLGIALIMGAGIYVMKSRA
ncbi:MAG TPA: DMT family transporter [Nordella sp.]|nr:DMT family transporter [Nordella sp.]